MSDATPKKASEGSRDKLARLQRAAATETRRLAVRQHAARAELDFRQAVLRGLSPAEAIAQYESAMGEIWGAELAFWLKYEFQATPEALTGIVREFQKAALDA